MAWSLVSRGSALDAAAEGLTYHVVDPRNAGDVDDDVRAWRSESYYAVP